jgi:hypothetical protein
VIFTTCRLLIFRTLVAAFNQAPTLKPTICLLLMVVAVLTTVNAQSDFARNGVLDLRQWNFDEAGYVELNGEWDFYMSELLSPNEVQSNSVKRDFINFPSTWNEYSKSFPATGFATYHLSVILPEVVPMAIEVPHFYSNYALWINGEQVSANGQVGKTAKESKAQWLPKTVNFDPKNDTLDIVIQASNFHHAKGGVREPIRIGGRAELNGKRELAIMSTSVLCGGLIIIAFCFVAVFFFKPEPSALFFAALCLTWAIRESFSNIYLFTAAYPDFPWEFAVRIEYVTLYLTMIWAALFLASTFPHDVGSIFKYLLIFANLMFVAFTLITETSLFTQFLPVYLSTAAILLLYIIYVLVRAIVYDRKGVWVMVSCMMLGVIIFSYDIIAYEGFASYNSMITHSGYLGMFLLMGLCLTIQFGFIRKSSGAGDMLTYDDLYGTSKK